jgi:hypothetical protein
MWRVLLTYKLYPWRGGRWLSALPRVRWQPRRGADRVYLLWKEIRGWMSERQQRSCRGRNREAKKWTPGGAVYEGKKRVKWDNNQNARDLVSRRSLATVWRVKDLYSELHLTRVTVFSFQTGHWTHQRKEKVERNGSCFWTHTDVHAIVQKSIIQGVYRQDCITV